MNKRIAALLILLLGGFVALMLLFVLPAAQRTAPGIVTGNGTPSMSAPVLTHMQRIEPSKPASIKMLGRHDLSCSCHRREASAKKVPVGYSRKFSRSTLLPTFACMWSAFQCSPLIGGPPGMQT